MKGTVDLTYLLTKKELKSYFSRPLLYLIFALFMLVTGWLFFNYLVASKELTNLSLEQSILKPLLGNINFLLMFLVPLITMRQFSEEKKDETLSLLFRSNLSEKQIITGKMLASFVIASLLVLSLFIYPLILSFSGFTNWSIFITGIIGLLFSSLLYVAIGLFCSSLTNSQMVAALFSYVLLFSMMFLVMSANSTNNFVVAQILQYMSFLFHFEQFAVGLVQSYSIVFFLSMVGFFYFLTNCSLQARKW